MASEAQTDKASIDKAKTGNAKTGNAKTAKLAAPAVSGVASGQRFFHGPRPVGALMPAVTRTAFRKRSPATATLLTEWDRIVGPALAAVTTPRRLAADSLTIACDGPVAMELQHLAPQLIERINSHFGRVLVGRLRFVQHGMVPGAPRPAPRPPSTPAIIAAAENAVAALPAGELRDALAALGRAVMAETGLPRSVASTPRGQKG